MSPGKRVHGSLYVHREAVRHLELDLRERARRALHVAGRGADASNVLRLDPDGRVALLAYEDFDSEAFPALREAWLVDPRGRVRHRTYRSSDNPPILHRKELLLPLDDPRRARFARLTAELEARGLFRDARAIGRRRAWQERLADAGLRVDNHDVVEIP